MISKRNIDMLYYILQLLMQLLHLTSYLKYKRCFVFSPFHLPTSEWYPCISFQCKICSFILGSIFTSNATWIVLDNIICRILNVLTNRYWSARDSLHSVWTGQWLIYRQGIIMADQKWNSRALRKHFLFKFPGETPQRRCIIDHREFSQLRLTEWW